MNFKAINPATGETLNEYTGHSKEETGQRLANAEKARTAWKKTSFDVRAGLLYRLSDLLEQNKEELARLMAGEMGKVLREGVKEIEKCALLCRYYAENAAGFLEPEQLKSDGSKSYVRFDPLGPVLAIMPWNFPFWQVYRFSAPALMAGNPVLLKHAPNVPGCALKIEALMKEAGAPEGVFQTLMIDTDAAADVIADRRVRAVTFTGSTKGGREVAALAGRNLKKTVLELGGSDPYVILDDADIDKALEACVAGRMLNSGQSCIAAKRFIITQKNYETFSRKLTDALGQKKYGLPFEDSSDFGPLARPDLRDKLHDQVQRSIDAGARPLLGCEVPEGKGNFYPASVLADVRPGMPAFDEELFGPVAAVIKAKDEDDAIALANNTVYGLGAAVFTEDVEKGEAIAAERLQAGSCFVNDFVRSAPQLPFGGIGDSGYGRELSRWGIHEFVNVKTVYVR